METMLKEPEKSMVTVSPNTEHQRERNYKKTENRDRNFK